MGAPDNDGGTTYHFIVEESHNRERLDKFLVSSCASMDLSRARIKALILDGYVEIEGSACISSSKKVCSGDDISIVIPAPEEATPQPEDIPLDIIYEDDDLLVINKPAGLVVHPGAGNIDGTLVNALLFYCGDSLSGIGGVKRPGIVHRLDKDTTGLMVAAKNDRAHHALSAQLADRSLTRCYKAVVWRVPTMLRGKIDKSIGRHRTNRLKMSVDTSNGKNAVTNYTRQDKFGEAACLVECSLESGRTHQIRVHMESISHPLVGDPLYGIQTNAAKSLLKKAGIEPDIAEKVAYFPRQALHAWKISFIHPSSGEVCSYEQDLPDDMKRLISCLKTAR